MSVDASFEYVIFLLQIFPFLIRHCVLVYGDVLIFYLRSWLQVFLALLTKVDYVFQEKVSLDLYQYKRFFIYSIGCVS